MLEIKVYILFSELGEDLALLLLKRIMCSKRFNVPFEPVPVTPTFVS